MNDDFISRQGVLDYIHRILNQGMGKKKSFEFIQKYVEKIPSVNSQEPTWVTGADGAKIAFKDVPAWKVIKICEILGDVVEVEEDQEPTGHWEWLTEDKYRCSNCNSETRVDECLNEPMYEFCPFCGVKMSESEDKE